MCCYKEQIARWTKAAKNWELNSGVYIFIVLFHFVKNKNISLKIMQSEIIWSYYHLSSVDQNKKNV